MMLTRTCPFCGKTTRIEVDEQGYDLWTNGELIQNAFPMTTAMEREIIKTGMCASCQNQVFEPDEDDEDSEFWGDEDSEFWDDEDDESWDDEVGFDPYEGCYTYDC